MIKSFGGRNSKHSEHRHGSMRLNFMNEKITSHSDFSELSSLFKCS